jgi:hypothetical protein
MDLVSIHGCWPIITGHEPQPLAHPKAGVREVHTQCDPPTRPSSSPTTPGDYKLLVGKEGKDKNSKSKGKEDRDQVNKSDKSAIMSTTVDNIKSNYRTFERM